MKLRRPAWVAGICWGITCLIGAWLSSDTLQIALAVGAVGLVVLIAVRLLRRFRLLLFCWITVCLALVSLYAQYLVGEQPLQRLVGTSVSLQVEVCETTPSTVVQVLRGDLPRGTRLYYWNAAEAEEPELYQQLSGTFVLHTSLSEGLWKLQAKANGLCFAISPEKTPQITAGQAPPYAIPEGLREQAVSAVNRYVFGDAGAVITGICFGADGDLSAQAIANFRVCGITHLFSVSGFHLAVIAQGVMWLLRKLRFSRVWRAVFTALVVVFFMALVGFGPSVIRAGVLCLMVQLGSCTKRQADSRNSLGLALLLLLVGNPYAVYDVGLLLSFFATFGLIWLCEPMRKAALNRLPLSFYKNHPRLYMAANGLVTSCCLTLSATITTAPIIALYFGDISVVSVLSNLLLSLPASVVVVVGCIACALSLISDIVAIPLFFISGVAARYVLWVAQQLSRLPVAMITLQEGYLVLWLIGSLLLLYGGYRLLRRRGMVFAALMAIAVLVIALLIRQYTTQGVTRIRVAALSRDVAVCVQGDGKTALFLSPDAVGDVYDARAQLRQDGIDAVDILVIADGAYEAVNAIPAVLESVTEQTVLLYAPTLTDIPAYYQTAIPLGGEAYELWSGAAIRQEQGFFLLEIGATSLLIFPNNGDLEQVLGDYRAAEATICRGNYLHNTHLLQSPVVILPAPTGAASFAAARQLEFLNTNSILLLTRGNNDIYGGV